MINFIFDDPQPTSGPTSPFSVEELQDSIAAYLIPEDLLALSLVNRSFFFLARQYIEFLGIQPRSEEIAKLKHFCFDNIARNKALYFLFADLQRYRASYVHIRLHLSVPYCLSFALETEYDCSLAGLPVGAGKEAYFLFKKNNVHLLNDFSRASPSCSVDALKKRVIKYTRVISAVCILLMLVCLFIVTLCPNNSCSMRNLTGSNIIEVSKNTLIVTASYGIPAYLFQCLLLFLSDCMRDKNAPRKAPVDVSLSPDAFFALVGKTDETRIKASEIVGNTIAIPA